MDDEMPSNAEWSRDCRRGDRVVRKAMATLGIELSKANSSNRYSALAAGYGAISAIGAYMRALSGPDNHVAEQWAMAMLRGALRGADQPIHDDGRPFTQANDG